MKIIILVIGVTAAILMGIIFLALFTKEESNKCPIYIDCMPGPGRDACSIPLGCEGITHTVQ